MRVLVLISMLFSVNAFAGITDRGYDCSMSYKVDGSLMPGVFFTKGWLADGEYFTDSSLKVHTVSLTAIEKNVGEAGPQTYWKVEVNDEDSSVALMEVPDNKSLQFTIPVNVTEDEPEDPRTFNSLTISCDPAYFAG